MLKKMILILAHLIASSLLSAQTHTNHNIIRFIQGLEHELSQSPYDSEKMALSLERYYRKLDETITTSAIYQELDRVDRSYILKHSFLTRLKIKKAFQNRAISASSLLIHQKMLRALRYLEDYILEAMHVEGQLEEKNYTTLEGEGEFFMINPDFASKFSDIKDLESGDVILSRGNAYASAAIARVGRVDTLFSHMSFVFGQPDGLYTTEAHIEIGSVVAPIHVHQEQANVRTVVYRYEDQTIANRASSYIFYRVRAAQNAGHNIEYDFAMNNQDDKRIFCSEVVSQGFIRSAGIDVPLHKTRFERGELPFLKILGLDISKRNLETFKTFGPGDIDYDPRFTLIAEWKNPTKLKDTRMKDAVLTMIYQFMGYGYQFDSSLKIGSKAIFGWLARRTPILRRDFLDRFPLNMNLDQLKLFMMLDLVAQKLYERLEIAHNRSPYPLTLNEMYRVLEEYRHEDFRRYVHGRIFGHIPGKSDFHKWFNPH